MAGRSVPFALVLLILTFAPRDFSEDAIPANTSKPMAMETSRFVYKSDNYDFNRHFSIANDMNRYVVSILQSKNNHKRPPSLSFSVSEPSGALSRHGPIFRLTINGISNDRLVISDDKVKRWVNDKGDQAGYEIQLNFDGVRMALRFFMDSRSPLLFCELSHLDDSIEELKSAVIQVHACVALSKDAKNRWSFKPYAREIVTPKRVIAKMSRTETPLLPDETWLIIRDAIYDGSEAGKGNGPAYLIFDGTKVSKATVKNSVYQPVTLELKPDFGKITMGFWKNAKRFSNSEFADYVKNNDLSPPDTRRATPPHPRARHQGGVSRDGTHIPTPVVESDSIPTDKRSSN